MLLTTQRVVRCGTGIVDLYNNQYTVPASPFSVCAASIATSWSCQLLSWQKSPKNVAFFNGSVETAFQFTTPPILTTIDHRGSLFTTFPAPNDFKDGGVDEILRRELDGLRVEAAARARSEATLREEVRRLKRRFAKKKERRISVRTGPLSAPIDCRAQRDMCQGSRGTATNTSNTCGSPALPLHNQTKIDRDAREDLETNLRQIG